MTTSTETTATQRLATSQETRSLAILFGRVRAIGLGVLILVTLPIWFHPWWPEAGFPRVPWIAIPGGAWGVAVVETLALLGLVLGLIVAMRWGIQRWCWWGIAAALATLVVLDQHRLQPWAYQSMLYAVILGGLPWREGRRWVMALAISVYFYSAFGKLDFQFVHTVGHQMVQTLAAPIGGLGEATATKLAFALPLGELSIALALMFPRTRRIAGVAAAAMHLTLIGLLGPWSLGHSLGVLAWNGLLAVEVVLLFVVLPRGEAGPESAEHSESNERSPASLTLRWAIRMPILAALLLPLSERSGYWDHWTSWALYSPHNSRVDVQIHDSAIDRLPDRVAKFLAEDDDGDRWRDLDLGGWSLDQRRVPVYPQARYQLQLALALAKRHDLGPAIRVKLKSASDRWTGKRQETFLIGQGELERRADRPWLGVPSP
ncbi:hypothetical protein [Stieleria mannarensis]|uniref:hypothetical protein n=1 Tax=Stieleria mannarensis TaxID=2755585 RepID=UPI00160045E3|nr:hypothetical protein [Rhodopirellula sp. JC639]